MSKVWLMPAAETPLTIYGLRLSNVPIAESRIVPPFGAAGLA